MRRRVVGIALFCLVLLAAIFAGYWDMLNTEKVRIAREKAGPTSGEATALVEPKATPEPGAAATGDTGSAPEPARGPAPAADRAPSAETASALPTFDILRVEPDGSTVMAGRAAAGTTVRLTDGTTVLGEETAGPGGEFAIVLDKPLPVGEHQIRIEATGADGAAATSRETAIVSVPERGREDELLAMVETPDQPSRLISVPKGEPQPERGAAGDAAPDAATGTGAAGTIVAPEPATEPDTATGTPQRSAASERPSDVPNATIAPETANGTSPTPETEIGTAASSGTAAAPADIASPPAGSPMSAPPSAGTTKDTARSAAAAEASAASPPSGHSSNLVVASGLAVEAVEIEDETIYVAGRAPAGPTIRIYVDNVFLAEDAGRKTDRFLVSTKSAVTPGEHMVRADQIAGDGSVVARVEVPFLKPEGRSMSAVADAATEASGGDANGAPPTETASASAPSGQGVSSGTSGQTMPSAAKGESPPPAKPAAGKQASSPPGDPAAPTPSGAIVSAPANATTAPAKTAAPVAAAGTRTVEPDTSQAQGGTASDGSVAGSDIAAARQAPLQAAGARVIIRRGDTLWRISRETYGRGARYTTIYLANGDQIRNPNRIYPGQVFRMPERAAD